MEGSLAHDWGLSAQYLEPFVVKSDAQGKEDPAGAIGRVKDVLKELYGMVTGLFYFYASSGSSDLDVSAPEAHSHAVHSILPWAPCVVPCLSFTTHTRAQYQGWVFGRCLAAHA